MVIGAILSTMGVDRWPVDFRYISSRLVRQIVQQDQTYRLAWRLRTISLLHGMLGFQRDSPDRDNEFALCREATEAVRDLTGTISEYESSYIRAQVDLTMGFLTVHMGWQTTSNVEIAVMKADVNVPDVGKVLVALFGSASNYRGRRPVSDGSAEIPSDVDGLYGILERTRELADPQIDHYELDRDLGHSPDTRADTAVSLLGQRFKGFEQRRLDVLMQRFCVAKDIEPYDLVILGAPIWVATPEPSPINTSTVSPE
ncbi:DUF7019 family protein [Ferrimicrobium acidiphilum]|uniref:DUF7019 family protein n=1 Tax=Ferrimicrobium acidiphilum TaxID=121039 RepID=UPI000556A52E|nr:hypothetical protein [Ferrimicrobium acidiphilum]